jgi:D-serine deaminase-like pyridoxal phosphate-dependent protein
MTIHDLTTPCVLVDVDRLDKNIRALQEVCTKHGVELWPHIKTHKSIAILKRQLAAGASGMTCAKLGEAEALLPSGVRKVFIAHSLVNPVIAPRLRALADSVDQLLLAVTSLAHVPHLESVVRAAGIKAQVMVALDTGLGREGARSIESLQSILNRLHQSDVLEPFGIYTHEGHCYRSTPETMNDAIDQVYAKLIAASDVVGPQYRLAPGCTVSAARMASKPRVSMVRPGAYLMGDLSMAQRLPLMAWEDVAATVLATVIDRPDSDLALIDAGSKTFSGDKNAQGQSGADWLNPSLVVAGVNEEHGYVRGPDVDLLQIGERRRFVVNHICPVMNLADSVFAVRGEEVLEEWPVEGRGRVH